MLCTAVTDALHHLAEAGLPVGSSLAGHNEINTLETCIEIDEIEYGLDAGFHLCVQEDLQCRAKSAGCTAALDLIRVDTEFTDDDITIVLHALLETIENLRCATLLLSEGIGRTIRSAERIGHITHDGEVRLLYRRIEATHIDVRHLLEVLATTFQYMSVLIEETDAEGGGEPHAAIIGRRSSDRDGDLRVAGIERRLQQLTGAIGGGVQRVSLLLRHHRKSGCRCHLEDRLAFGQPTIEALLHLHQRAVHRHRDDFSTSRLYNGIGRTLAAVRDRHATGLTAAENLLCCLREELDGLVAREGSLKGIRSKK